MIPSTVTDSRPDSALQPAVQLGQSQGIFSSVQPCRPCQPCATGPVSAVRPPQPEYRVEYVKVQRKVVEYVQEWVEEDVPVKRVTHEQRKVMKEVAKERKVNEFFKVETITEFKPQVRAEPVQSRVKKEVRVPKYIPKETDVVHYSEGLWEEVRKGNVVFEPALLERLRNAQVGQSIPPTEQSEIERRSSELPVFKASTSSAPLPPAAQDSSFFTSIAKKFKEFIGVEESRTEPADNLLPKQPTQLLPQPQPVQSPLQQSQSLAQPYQFQTHPFQYQTQPTQIQPELRTSLSGQPAWNPAPQTSTIQPLPQPVRSSQQQFTLTPSQTASSFPMARQVSALPTDFSSPLEKQPTAQPGSYSLATFSQLPTQPINQTSSQPTTLGQLSGLQYPQPQFGQSTQPAPSTQTPYPLAQFSNFMQSQQTQPQSPAQTQQMLSQPSVPITQSVMQAVKPLQPSGLGQ